jgi:hypothetical protein
MGLKLKIPENGKYCLEVSWIETIGMAAKGTTSQEIALPGAESMMHPHSYSLSICCCKSRKTKITGNGL